MGMFASISDIFSRTDERTGDDRRKFERFASSGLVHLTAQNGSRVSGKLIDLSYGGFLSKFSSGVDLSTFVGAEMPWGTIELEFFDSRIRLGGVVIRADSGILAMNLVHEVSHGLADLRNILEPMQIGKSIRLAHVETAGDIHKYKLTGEDDCELSITAKAADFVEGRLMFREGGRAFECIANAQSTTMTSALFDNTSGSNINLGQLTNTDAMGLGCFILLGISEARCDNLIKELTRRIESQIINDRKLRRETRAA